MRLQRQALTVSVTHRVVTYSQSSHPSLGTSARTTTSLTSLTLNTSSVATNSLQTLLKADSTFPPSPWQPPYRRRDCSTTRRPTD
jgi:hypothetical protein